jgi:hypothetical protein
MSNLSNLQQNLKRDNFENKNDKNDFGSVITEEVDTQVFTEKDIGFNPASAKSLSILMDFRESADHETRERVLAGKPEINDNFVIGPFRFTYLNEANTSTYKRPAGWKIECEDKTTPMKDLVMPDKVFDIDVVYGAHCFKDCYNIASVAHVSSFLCEDPIQGYSLFGNSGIREIPKQLFTNNSVNRLAIANFCSNAYAINNIKELNNALSSYFTRFSDSNLKNFDIYNFLNALIKNVSEEKETILNTIEGEFSPYKLMQKASLYLEPIGLSRHRNSVIHDVYIAHTFDNKTIIFNPFIENKEPNLITFPCEIVASKFDHFAFNFQESNSLRPILFNFQNVSADVFADKLKSIYDASINELNNQLETELLQSIEVNIINDTEKADKAQVTLDYEIKDIDYDSILNPKASYYEQVKF